MNSRIVISVIVFWCCHALGDDTKQNAELKDPTLPFNSGYTVEKNSSKIHVKASKPQWVLDAIIVSENGKKVLLNGRWYKELEHVGEWQVALIEASSVLLKRNKASKRIFMYPNLTTNTENFNPE
jgi:hypothetical protein